MRKAVVRTLTERECEVLNRLAEGRSNKDIADRLGISDRTVQKHLQRIYAKLAVKNRMAAIVLMARSRS